MFLFDEPTTGLHFDDVAKLLGAFKRLLDAGHSLVVIEHNLDVIRAADWIIDLGPEGGERGGRLVAAGTPAEVMRCEASHTGRALREHDIERTRLLASAARRRRPSVWRQPAPRVADASARRDRRAQRARAQPAQRRRRDPARRHHGGHRRVGLRQVHARVRHRVRRRPAPLPRVAERVRAPVRAAGGAPGRRRDLRHSADGGDRAAHQPRRPQEHGGHAHRGLPLPAPAVRQARHAALPGLRGADRAAERGRDRRATAARSEGQAHRAARAAGRGAQGLLHRSREVGGRQGLQHAARRRRVPADGAVAASRPLPGAHHRAAGRQRAGGRAARSASCAACCSRRSTSARASRTCSTAASVRVFSTRRACPSCGRSFAELDPRLFSYNSKHGWCESCFGTGRGHQGLRRRADRRGNLVERLVRRRGGSLRRLRRPAAQPGRAQRAVPRPLHRRAGRAAGRRRAPVLRRPEARWAASARSPATCSPRSARGSPSCTTSASATSRSTARRRRCPAARRSASASPRSSARTCTASATCSTSRPSACTRATTACCSTRSTKLGAKGNTLLVVEHDEDTIRRADHVIDLGPGAGTRGGHVVGEGRIADLIAAPESLTGRFLAHPLLHPLAGRRAVRRADPALEIARRGAAQPAQGERADAARPAHRGHRRVGLGQVHARARRAVREPARARRRREAPSPGAGLVRLQGAARRGTRRARARGGPDADRQDAALLPGHLRRVLGRHPQAVRRHHRGARARLRAEPLLVQHGGRPLRGLRRPGRADHRDELPARREGAVRRLRRAALQRRDAGRAASRPQHRRRAGDERRRGGRVLRRAPAHPPRAAAAAGRGPRLPDARPAEPDALRRRGAAHQAGDGARATPAAGRSAPRRAPRPAPCTCSTSRPSACTWPTSRS